MNFQFKKTLSTILFYVSLYLQNCCPVSRGINVQITLEYSGGCSEGVKTALAHGCAVGIYAFATAASLAAVLTGSPLAFRMIQWMGAFFLLFLGIKALLFGATGIADATRTGTDFTYSGNGLRSGFLTAFLNPKLAIFFGALFSQFVSAEAQFGEKMVMALTAALIDAGWYLLVVLVVLSQ